jgi:DNA-binding FadR family transcriptional regulator
MSRAVPALPAERRARRSHAADGVFAQLAVAILRGQLQPGEALPPERLLAERFEVSRIIARQAVHRLAEHGLCKVRQGGATTVLDPRQSADVRVLELEHRLGPGSADDQRAFAERLMLGGHMMLFLAERRGRPADFARIRAVVEDYARAGGRDEDTYAFEERFFLAVAAATHNRLVELEASWWFRLVRETPRARHPLVGTPEMRIAAYREIARRLGDKGDAAGLYLSFLQTYLAGLKTLSLSRAPSAARSRRRRP